MIASKKQEKKKITSEKLHLHVDIKKEIKP